MNTKLITALRTAAKALEQGTFAYSWDQPSQCNCGSLFCALTGKAPAELKEAIPKSLNDGGADWSTLTGQYCPIAGVPTHRLFREILSYGLTPKDILDLEYLENKDVIARMDLTVEATKFVTVRRWFKNRTEAQKEVSVRKPNHENPFDVAAYMRAWADLLTERGQLDAAPTAETHSFQIK